MPYYGRDRIKHSCPDFDAAIEHIESARKINGALRDKLEEFEAELEELRVNYSELEEQLANAKEEIVDLTNELKKVDA